MASSSPSCKQKRVKKTFLSVTFVRSPHRKHSLNEFSFSHWFRWGCLLSRVLLVQNHCNATQWTLWSWESLSDFSDCIIKWSECQSPELSDYLPHLTTPVSQMKTLKGKDVKCLVQNKTSWQRRRTARWIHHLLVLGSLHHIKKIWLWNLTVPCSAKAASHHWPIKSNSIFPMLTPF